MTWFSKIKTLRKDDKLTQDELAQRLGVDRSTVANWEQGRRKPDADAFAALARIFDVSIDYLMDAPVRDDFVTHLMKQAENFFASDKISEQDKEKIAKDIMDLYFKRRG